MPDLLTLLWQWVILSRISYWGSHWSANVLVAIPTVLLIVKVWSDRWGEQATKHLAWWVFLPLLLFDAAVAGLFVGSLHEAIFEPYFVGVTLAWQTVPLSAYIHEWTANVNVWQSWCILWSVVTVSGFVWFRGKYARKLTWWVPFILVCVVWAAIALPVSLPFPTQVATAPWCHDCAVPNGAEFLYNLTFAIGFIGSFNLLQPVRKLLPEMRLATKFLLGSIAGVVTGILVFQLLLGKSDPSLANILGYVVGFFANYGVQRLTKTVRH